MTKSSSRFKAIRSAASSAVAVALLAYGSTASAHTIAIGTVNAGAPGSVTVWLGSYHTGAPNEGSLTIDATTLPFDLLSASQPAGLVFGNNTFYASNSGTPGEYNSLINPCCDITQWQGVTFTGLTAGDHPYSVSGMFTVNFADWNSSAANWEGTVNIPEGSVGGAPEPASLLLLGTGGLGLIARLRRRKQPR